MNYCTRLSLSLRTFRSRLWCLVWCTGGYTVCHMLHVLVTEDDEEPSYSQEPP